MKCENSEKGFTLIELLIVVAIIAILAAIAIPNFLQAQIRAKVSKAKAGMETGATALEAYYVDYNSYPGTYAPSGTVGWKQNTWALPIFLTTPIAYITTIPIDPFDVFNGEGPDQIPIKYRIAGWAYNSGTHTPAGPPVLGTLAQTVEFYVNVGSGNPDDDVEYTDREANQTSVQYCLFSPGPGNSITSQYLSDNNSDDYPQPYRLWYDPTNGTVSLGFIVRESSGIVSP